MPKKHIVCMQFCATNCAHYSTHILHFLTHSLIYKDMYNNSHNLQATYTYAHWHSCPQPVYKFGLNNKELLDKRINVTLNFVINCTCTLATILNITFYIYYVPNCIASDKFKVNLKQIGVISIDTWKHGFAGVLVI